MEENESFIRAVGDKFNTNSFCVRKRWDQSILVLEVFAVYSKENMFLKVRVRSEFQ